MRWWRFACGLAMSVSGACAAAQGITLAECLSLALEHSAHVAVQRNGLDLARAGELAARAPFDTTAFGEAGRRRAERGLRSDERQFFPGPDTTRTLEGGYQLGFGQMLGNGMALKASAGFISHDDQFERITGLHPTSSGTVTFGLNVPLGKNQGSIASASLEAAGAEVRAAQADLEYATAATLRDVAFAYWDYVAKTRRLAVAVASHERSTALVRELERMIAADEVPAAELNMGLANQAQRAAVRSAAQAELLDARRRLVRAMGLGAAKMAALPAPGDDFPLPPAQVPVFALHDRLDDVLARRADVRGAALRAEAGKARLVGAREARKPQVDLALEVSSNGLREDTRFGGAAFREQRGTSAGATLSFAWPMRNSGGKAELLAASSRLDTLHLAQREQRDIAATGILAAADRVARAVEELRAAREAARRLSAALGAEQVKRRSGLSTLLDVIGLEDRLHAAQLTEADLAQQYGGAIAQLRFELAQLLHPAPQGGYTLRAADFFQLPDTTDLRP